ncbi:uncharacterized protein EAF01_000524 [Botrytis porri]|uniref:Uncharacterized protein n=1 Tax=Botrytis porri TaxID=87229 RepID=A0A4Z1L1M5_9HELO|nr:uncharacterized protein EAF01_000524 [Botrytis porri]KAF7914118.1 hypothetical protein EAF01_000524 [Botrytis porri]TGO90493.1 hypothetical protein BPOR_0062g00130 [Botrytis porri]
MSRPQHALLQVPSHSHYYTAEISFNRRYQSSLVPCPTTVLKSQYSKEFKSSVVLLHLGLFYEPTATTVFSTKTAIPVQATGAQRRELLTLGDKGFAVSGLVSSLNLGAIEPSPAPIPDITLFKPHAVVFPGLVATETDGQPIQAIVRRGTEEESAVDIPTFTTLSSGKPPVSTQNSPATITARQNITALTLIGCGTAPGGLITCARTTFNNCVSLAGGQTCNGRIPSPTSTTNEVQSFLWVAPTTLQRGGDTITTKLISGLFRTTLQARASLAPRSLVPFTETLRMMIGRF